eukprot:TRINITY_DN12541_c0_g1_i1.p1 TRINITY_DN12541_c0_g1~~TRINITY_DN12541_c0_g1_i1.p1  ORF type:complete len:418 (+),score=25.05 TRINITY_DN12541_c0_g1_i1:114-1367(+)
MTSRVRLRYFPRGSQKSNLCRGSLYWNDRQVAEYITHVAAKVRSSLILRDELDFLMSKEKRCFVGPDSFRALLGSLVSSPVVCRSVFDKMEECSIPRTSKHYDPLLDMYYREGNLPGLLSATRLMKSSGCSPTQYTYRTMMLAFAKAKKHDFARQVFNSMQADGVVPQILCIKAAIRTSANLEKAMEIINKFDLQWPLADSHPHKHHEEKVFECLVTACLNDRDLKGCKWVLKNMESMGIKKSLAIYQRILELHYRIGDVEECHRVWGQLVENSKKRGDLLPASVINRYLLVCKENVSSACGNLPSIWCDRANEAFTLFREYEDRRPGNWELLTKTLAKLYYKKGDVDALKHLLQIVRSEKVLKIDKDFFIITYMNQMAKMKIQTIPELHVRNSYSSDIQISGAPVTATSRTQLPKW